MKTWPGVFISLEGGEGAGKTSLQQALAAWLRTQGQSVCLTREPGGTPLAEYLRQGFLKFADMDADTELLLLFAARRDHLKQVIAPALWRGEWVICDRFIDSSYVYQGVMGGVPEAHLEALTARLVLPFLPDCTFWLDVDAERGLARVAAKNRFEEKSLVWHVALRAAFAQRAAACPQRIQKLDANAAAAQVLAEAKRCLVKRFPDFFPQDVI
jgi:dTMP kinase